ncbi:hypothetical protein GCM10009839_22790 [Catenulispora yoronensis]|uniref:Uncharacterized protein n=1 Tax=Catenulispora yoronensis TaxID=450799 RepID=A0ABN2TXT5_9ACTN
MQCGVQRAVGGGAGLVPDDPHLPGPRHRLGPSGHGSHLSGAAGPANAPLPVSRQWRNAPGWRQRRGSPGARDCFGGY